jgi:hypothetical protein
MLYTAYPLLIQIHIHPIRGTSHSEGCESTPVLKERHDQRDSKSTAAPTQHGMYATLLAQPVGWVRSTRQTARTSSATVGPCFIFGHSVLLPSFHNPVAVQRSLLAAFLCSYLYRFRRLPAAPRNANVRRAYPRPRTCQVGVRNGRDRGRSWPVVPTARIHAGHLRSTLATAPTMARDADHPDRGRTPWGTVLTAPGCAVVPTARIVTDPLCGTGVTAPGPRSVATIRMVAGHPCRTVATAPGCAVVPATRIKAAPSTTIDTPPGKERYVPT